MKKYSILTSGAFIKKIKIKPYNIGNLSQLKFAVKDNIDIKNHITGFGNPTWLQTHSPATAHAICVDLLLSEGATCIGKTITDEFTYSLLGENYFYGTPVNPNFPDRVPGGSSSGSASSVACGIVDFALGTDTGGSIRVPASYCGIYGYRPTYGRISTAGVIQLAPSLDTVGIFAKNFSILESVAEVLLNSKININRSNKTKKNIVIIKDILDVCHSDVKNSFLSYINSNLKSSSIIKLAKIFSSSISLHDLFDLYNLIHSSEVWSVHGPWIQSKKPKLGPIADYNFHRIAKTVDRKKIRDGSKKKEWFAKKLQEYLINNILCFPTVVEIAPKKNVYNLNPQARKASSFFQYLIGINAISSLSRSPQITIPTLINTNNNIPIGISFLAGQFEDELLFYTLRKKNLI